MGVQKIIEKSLVIAVILVFAIIAFKRRLLFGIVCVDIDEYMLLFESYMQKGFYVSVADGTSIIFNFFLKVIYYFINDTPKTFYVLNTISQSLIALFGAIILFRFKGVNGFLKLVYILYFFLLWVNDEQHGLSRNDIFFGAQLMLVYVLIFNKSQKNIKFILLGVLFCFAISTRALFLIYIPSLLLCFYLKFPFSKALITLTVFVFGVFLLHYPSIKEKSNLSFYGKQVNVEKSGFNWDDINTLATLKMFDEGSVELIVKNNYWGWTKEKVDFYKKKYNIVKSPSNFLEFMISYPFYYFKLIGLNIVNVTLYLFRRYSLYLFIPFILFVIKRKSINHTFFKENLAFSMFILTLMTLLTVSCTVIEFRWLIGVEFLFLYAIVTTISKLKSESYFNKNVMFLFNMVSLSLLLVMNLRTLII